MGRIVRLGVRNEMLFVAFGIGVLFGFRDASIKFINRPRRREEIAFTAS